MISKGIILEQYKEPALSRDLRQFTNAATVDSTFNGPLVEDVQSLTGEDIIEIARKAEIVDERDGVLLYEKLRTVKKGSITAVVADAIDDEPYISSQLNPLLQLKEDAIGGLKLAAKVLGVSSTYVAVYKNLIDLEMKIPTSVLNVPVKRIRGKYPVEFRIAESFNKEKGVLLIGVCALIHLCRAVRENRIATTCFITVAGNCVGNPANIEVSIGMTVTQILEHCGLIDDPTRVLVGGPMTGIAVKNTDQTIITTTTRAILAYKDDEKEFHYSCVGCGKCVQVCPEMLTPYMIYHLTEKKQMFRLSLYDPQQCIGCGTCSYVCPSRLDVSGAVKRAKQYVRAERQGGADR